MSLCQLSTVAIVLEKQNITELRTKSESWATIVTYKYHLQLCILHAPSLHWIHFSESHCLWKALHIPNRTILHQIKLGILIFSLLHSLLLFQWLLFKQCFVRWCYFNSLLCFPLFSRLCFGLGRLQRAKISLGSLSFDIPGWGLWGDGSESSSFVTVVLMLLTVGSFSDFLLWSDLWVFGHWRAISLLI